jgi:hypothetical protein
MMTVEERVSEFLSREKEVDDVSQNSCSKNSYFIFGGRVDDF